MISPPLLQQATLSWYAIHGRSLPWRQTTDPYAILVSEIMLQQTQADRVIPKYGAWLQQFPTIESLAQAPTAAIIRAWAGLGYNRRALYLQRAAQQLVSEKTVPAFKAGTYPFEQLAGVGPYTAAAIRSFAFNQDVALVDTNVKRIYQLLIFGDQLEPTNKQVQAIAEQFVPAGRSRDWHNALMDIGSILARYRGAAAQQRQFIELLPVLKEAELPSVSKQPLKRPKQSDYKTSKRFWRGKIVTLLRETGPITVNKLVQELGDLPYSLTDLLTNLERDGLITRRHDLIDLP